ncbi:MAG: enoyl-CoA hydratase [Bacteroidetes bacterium GWA2_31_9]|nr:MAG: enoyl-CoA hydratase [Bacteroidetes bacterium GWA2_31_9]
MNKKYSTIELEINNNLATVWLNRPEIRNALNETMISEIIDCFENINNIQNIRVVLLKGRGKSFCAGADLNWMSGVSKYTYQQNYSESIQLAKCFFSIYTCKKPVIAVGHGAAIGGANGLYSSADFAFCENETVFAFSEVNIGIIPATISPYIIKRTGEFVGRDLMFTGRKIKGKEAEQLHLVNKSLDSSELENHVNSVINELLTSGPEAVAKCKELIYNVVNNNFDSNIIEYTAKMIAEARMSAEGQEGMASFLEKRKAKWYE